MEIPEKFQPLIESIEKLTVVELAELVKVLEEKFGVSAAMPMMAEPATAEASAGEEKSAFTVKLTEVGTQKIEVIKVVRDVTGKGLKEAKDVVDAAATGPQVVAENLKKEDAEALKKRFETAGAKVELQ